MWDAQIVSRVLDRKQNEAVVFAVKLKNSDNLTIGCDILDMILDDIRFCSEIVVNGTSSIRSVPITFTDYTERLSESERSDEAYLDSIRISPVEGGLMQTIIDDLEERNAHLQETLDTVMYELKVTKERNQELSLDLDYAKAEVASESNDYYGIKSDDDVVDEPAVNEEPSVDVRVSEEPVASDIDSELEEVITEAVEELKVLEQVEDDPMNFTEVDKVAAKNVMRMKESKMDFFIDLSMSGRNVKACDEILEFLKVDYKLCDLIVKLKLGDEDHLIKTLNDMLDLVQSEYKTPYQKFYVKNLSAQEKVFETVFNGLMEKAQRIMLVKLPIGA